MKRLIFSGLLSLAAVSCGGSSDKYKDLKATFCSGKSVTKAAITAANNLKDEAKTAALAAAATSCHGDYWDKVQDQAACEAKIVDDLLVTPDEATTPVKLSTLTADQLKAENDRAKELFGKTLADLKIACAMGKIVPAAD